MHSSIRYVALAVGLGVCASVGCDEGEGTAGDPGTSAGAATSASSTSGPTTAPSSSSGGTPCDHDGECECDNCAGQLGEDCSCGDCLPTAFCNPGQCIDDGMCTFRDSCTCAECDDDAYCKDPTHCDKNGVCNQFAEGCSCADCVTDPLCLDNYGGAGGTGGSP